MSPWHTQRFLMRTGLMWKLWAGRGAASCPSPSSPQAPHQGGHSACSRLAAGGKAWFEAA